MARNEYYVRPINGDDTNAGTSHAAAWKTVEYALDDIDRDNTDGDRINICDEGTLVIDDEWGFQYFGNPGNRGLVFQGYTSVVGDGGIFHIDCNDDKLIDESAYDNISLIDGKITNWDDYSLAIRLDNGCNLINMEFDGGGSCHKAVRFDDHGYIMGCVFKNFAGYGINKNVQIRNRMMFINNYVEVPASNIGAYVGDNNSAIGNIFVVGPAADTGLMLSNANNCVVMNNTFLASASSSGKGIYVYGSYSYGGALTNNYFEGFSNSGYGIYGSHAYNVNLLLSNNYYYNNTTNEYQVADTVRVINGPVTLLSSGVMNNAWMSGDLNLSPTKGLINNALVTQIALGDTVHSKDVGAVQRAKGVIGGPNMQAGRAR